MTQYASFFASAFIAEPVLEDMNLFIRSHRVIHVEKRLVDTEQGTGWLFLVEYLTGNAKDDHREQYTPRIDYKTVLDEKDYELFNRLRAARKELADATGNPVYAVFTNEQLAVIAKKRPATSKDLLTVPGVGDSRVAQYGERMISVVSGT